MKLQIENLGKVAITIEPEYWSSDKEYPRLTIVQVEAKYATYISRVDVPSGASLTDRQYWIPFSSLREDIVIDYTTFKDTVIKEFEDYEKDTTKTLTEWFGTLTEQFNDKFEQEHKTIITEATNTLAKAESAINEAKAATTKAQGTIVESNNALKTTQSLQTTLQNDFEELRTAIANGASRNLGKQSDRIAFVLKSIRNDKSENTTNSPDVALITFTDSDNRGCTIIQNYKEIIDSKGKVHPIITQYVFITDEVPQIRAYNLADTSNNYIISLRPVYSFGLSRLDDDDILTLSAFSTENADAKSRLIGEVHLKDTKLGETVNTLTHGSTDEIDSFQEIVDFLDGVEGSNLQEIIDGITANAANNFKYNTTIGDNIGTGYDVGGIKKGTKASELKNKTITQILDKILYPVIAAKVTAQPSCTVTINPTVKLVGTKFSGINISSNRGTVNYPTADGNTSYAGKEQDDQRTLEIKLNNTTAYKGIGSAWSNYTGTVVEEGDYTITATVKFDNGAQLKDSVGNNDNSNNANYTSTSHSNSTHFHGVYPVCTNKNNWSFDERVVDKHTVDYFNSSATFTVEIPAEDSNNHFKLRFPATLKIDEVRQKELSDSTTYDVPVTMNPNGTTTTYGISYEEWIRDTSSSSVIGKTYYQITLVKK